MGHRLSDAALDLLRRVEDAYPGTTFEHIPIEDGMIHADDWPADLWPPVIMARLLLPRFFDAGRVLHLDGDTLVLDDVAPLFDLSMDGKLIAAARDSRTMEIQMWRDADTDDLARDTEKVMNGYPATDYFNSGVILLDCGEVIRSGLDAWMARLMEVGITCPSIDQDVLNIIFKGRAEIVGQEWNIQILTYVDVERRHQEWQWMRRYLTCSPRILHFTGLCPKPWKPVEMRWFDDPHLLAEFGQDLLLYRSTANRLLAKALGEGADVMAEFDFHPPPLNTVEQQPRAPVGQAASKPLRRARPHGLRGGGAWPRLPDPGRPYRRRRTVHGGGKGLYGNGAASLRQLARSAILRSA